MRISVTLIAGLLCGTFSLAATASAEVQSGYYISRNTRSVGELCPTVTEAPSEVLPSGREIRRLYDELGQDGTRRQNMEHHIDDAKNDYEQIFINVLAYEQARNLYFQYMHQNATKIIISVAVEAGLLYFTAGSGNLVLKLVEGSPLLLRAASLVGSKFVTRTVNGVVTVVLFQATLKTADFVRVWYTYKTSLRAANTNVFNTYNEILEYKRLLACYYELIARRTNAGLNAYYDVGETLYVSGKRP